MLGSDHKLVLEPVADVMLAGDNAECGPDARAKFRLSPLAGLSMYRAV